MVDKSDMPKGCGATIDTAHETRYWRIYLDDTKPEYSASIGRTCGQYVPGSYHFICYCLDCYKYHFTW